MAAQISIEKKTEEEFKVQVEADGKTTHTVTLESDYYQKLTGGQVSAEALLRASFEFLLERESNQSILPKFKLQLINQYFPEFEREIEKRLGLAQK